jgi:hypothetical protein
MARGTDNKRTWHWMARWRNIAPHRLVGSHRELNDQIFSHSMNPFRSTDRAQSGSKKPHESHGCTWSVLQPCTFRRSVPRRADRGLVIESFSIGELSPFRSRRWMKARAPSTNSSSSLARSVPQHTHRGSTHSRPTESAWPFSSSSDATSDMPSFCFGHPRAHTQSHNTIQTTPI